MVPYDHARLSVRDHGGEVNDYLELHEFIDQSKAHTVDFRHRMFLHNTMAIPICEKAFGPVIAGVPTRVLVIEHITQDCSCVPTITQWLEVVRDNDFGRYNNPRKKDLEWLKNNPI